jgi:putative MATE family efflux protein
LYLHSIWKGANMQRAGTFVKKYLFGGREFYTSLLTIGLPLAVQNMIGTSLNMVDTILVGWLGMAQIAAVGIANQYYLLMSIIVLGIYSGCGVFISQFWGRKDTHNIGKVLGAGLLAGVSLAVVFTLPAVLFPEKIISIFNTDPVVIRDGAAFMRIVSLSYAITAVSFGFSTALRSIGKAVVPMVASIIALVINTILNYLLIFGYFGLPAMGVRGSATATLIARCVEVAILLVYVYGFEKLLAVRIAYVLELSGEFVGRIFKTVLPVVLNEGCWALGFVMYSVVYGRIGTNAIASVQIYSTIQNLFLVGIFGLASASAVMIGHKIGAGEEEEGKAYAWRFSLLSWIGGIVLGGALALLSPLILRGFNASGEVYYSALQILHIVSLIMPLRMFCIVLIVGILRGGGDAKYAFYFEAFTMWGIGVPLAFMGAFVFKLPVQWVVALVMFEEVAKFSLGLRRLISGKWIRNVIHGI